MGCTPQALHCPQQQRPMRKFVLTVNNTQHQAFRTDTHDNEDDEALQDCAAAGAWRKVVRSVSLMKHCSIANIIRTRHLSGAHEGERYEKTTPTLHHSPLYGYFEERNGHESTPPPTSLRCTAIGLKFACKHSHAAPQLLPRRLGAELFPCRSMMCGLKHASPGAGLMSLLRVAGTTQVLFRDAHAHGRASSQPARGRQWDGAQPVTRPVRSIE